MGTHKRRESGQKWEGYDQMQLVLENLASPKGTSANRVKAVASVALQYSKNYKDVVHDVEAFIWKTDKKHRLAGLYSMDAIMRQSRSKHGTKDTYVERFGERLATTIRAIREIPVEFQRNVRNVVREWEVRGYYSAEKITEDGGDDLLKITSDERLEDAANQEAENSDSQVKAGAKPSSEKIASLLSIIKKQKAKKEQNREETPDVSLLQTPSQPLSLPSQSSSYPPQPSFEHMHAPRQMGGPRPNAPPMGLRYPGNDGPVLTGHKREVHRDGRNWVDDHNEKRHRGTRWSPGRLENDKPTTNGPSNGSKFNCDGDAKSMHVNPSPHLISAEEARLPHRDHAWPPPGPTTDPYRDPQLSMNHGVQAPYPGHFPPDAAAFDPNMPPHPADSRYGPYVGPPSPSRIRHPSIPPNNQDAQQATEVCRKYISGRCGFGARCWHVHDRNVGPEAPRTRSEINQAKRKTVLCANYPNNCRFGDKCSFAHGEEDLDVKAMEALGRQMHRGGGKRSLDKERSQMGNEAHWYPPPGRIDNGFHPGMEGPPAGPHAEHGYPPYGPGCPPRGGGGEIIPQANRPFGEPNEMARFNNEPSRPHHGEYGRPPVGMMPPYYEGSREPGMPAPSPMYGDRIPPHM
ncbi:hypothetical protein ABG067_000712 [Albugo candida]